MQFTPPDRRRAANSSAEYDGSAFESGAGPLQVSYANYAGPFSSYIEPALKEIGIAFTPSGLNSGSLFGAQYCSSTIRPETQQRDSSQTSFLDSASGCSNLKVYAVTRAKKILFNSNRRAAGVRVVSPLGTQYTISARKEVVVSAGAFQSPQLLMVRKVVSSISAVH